MVNKYSQIANGTLFKSKGQNYRKVDDLYYEDINSGFQSTWNPIFDAGIELDFAPEDKGTAPVDVEFTVDPQSRLATRNPNYKKEKPHPSIEWFGKMWGSDEFDCGPEDYEWMALTAIDAVKAVKVFGIGMEDDFVSKAKLIQDTLVTVEDKLNIAQDAIQSLTWSNAKLQVENVDLKEKLEKAQRLLVKAKAAPAKKAAKKSTIKKNSL